jgi:hypothetical protein
VHQKTTAAEGEKHQNEQDGNGVQDVPGDRNPEHQHHNHYDSEGDQHFKTVDPGFGQKQDVLGEIDTGNDGFVKPDNFHAALYHLIEKAPHGQANEDVHGKILFPGVEHMTEHIIVNQHKAKGFQEPPDPVQVGVSDLYFQLRFCRYNRVTEVFLNVMNKTFDDHRIVPLLLILHKHIITHNT